MLVPASETVASYI